VKFFKGSYAQSVGRSSIIAKVWHAQCGAPHRLAPTRDDELFDPFPSVDHMSALAMATTAIPRDFRHMLEGHQDLTLDPAQPRGDCERHPTARRVTERQLYAIRARRQTYWSAKL
jgi:hypothetical protein